MQGGTALPVRVARTVAWLAAVTIATGLGLVAVNMVGDTASGRGPLGAAAILVDTPDLPAGKTSPRPGTPSVSRLLQFEFGSVAVRCQDAFATVIDANPAKGWGVGDIEEGFDDDVTVVFAQAAQIIEIEFVCDRGEPREAEREVSDLTPPGGSAAADDADDTDDTDDAR
ncbi:MAG: hypothetical protein ACT4PP_09180 [Sporichthyaceae bacterium]